MASKALRSIFQGLALTVANFLGILGAFALYVVFFRPAPQVPVQLPLAALLTASLFAAWLLLLRGRVVPKTPGEFVGVYVAAFALFPAVFVPAHFITQGYLTSFGNIVAVWCFQAPVNAAILLVAWWIAQARHAPGPATPA